MDGCVKLGENAWNFARAIVSSPETVRRDYEKIAKPDEREIDRSSNGNLNESIKCVTRRRIEQLATKLKSVSHKAEFLRKTKKLEENVSNGDLSPEHSHKWNSVRNTFPTSLEDRFLATENSRSSPNTADAVFIRDQQTESIYDYLRNSELRRSASDSTIGILHSPLRNDAHRHRYND
jgi:hypothetical protein